MLRCRTSTLSVRQELHCPVRRLSDSVRTRMRAGHSPPPASAPRTLSRRLHFRICDYTRDVTFSIFLFCFCAGARPEELCLQSLYRFRRMNRVSMNIRAFLSQSNSQQCYNRFRRHDTVQNDGEHARLREQRWPQDLGSAVRICYYFVKALCGL